MLILPFEQVLAQSPGTITLTGVVTEVSGAPLPGVNVFVNELSIGTITDADGRYSLSVPSDATITFSFTGFQTLEVPVDGRTSIDILMTESAEVLGEVVVIGYGITTKKELTGAVTSLKSEEFNRGTYSDPMGLVQGKVAGLSITKPNGCLLYTSPSPRDRTRSRMPSSA